MQLFFLVFFLLGLLLVFYPFAPLLAYSLFPPHPISNAPPTSQTTNMPAENWLRIPKIGVDIPVLEGDEKVLERGAWRIPQTSPDPESSNMVISAHRFRYRPPSKTTFYLLDKLSSGDTIDLFWNGRQIRYVVQTKRIVDATALSVLDPTDRPTLTLLTCHPLFSTKHRLIITATPQ